MPNFAVVNTTNTGQTLVYATATTYKTAIVVYNSSTNSNVNFTGAPGAFRRGKLYDILVGTAGTPADNYMEYDIVRGAGGVTTSSLGSVSSFSSGFGLDLADQYGAVNQIGLNSSTETTFGLTAAGEVWYVGVNQRASYRWVAAPGSEIVWPGLSSVLGTSAAGGNGIAGRARSGGYIGVTTMNWLFQE
jgi:hypothetical protein